MKRPHLPLLAALFLTVAAVAQNNPAPPLYPAPGNPADAQSQGNATALDNSQMPVFRVSCRRELKRSARPPASVRA